MGKGEAEPAPALSVKAEVVTEVRIGCEGCPSGGAVVAENRLAGMAIMGELSTLEIPCATRERAQISVDGTPVVDVIEETEEITAATNPAIKPCIEACSHSGALRKAAPALASMLIPPQLTAK